MSIKENITRIMSELLIIDDKIKHLNSKNKELKKERESIEIQLMDTLKKQNLQDKKFILNNKTLFLNTSSTLAPLNIKLVEEFLLKYIGQPKTNMIIKDIEKYRDDNKKQVLKVKRKIEKKSLKKKRI
jgi:hypothetical protein